MSRGARIALGIVLVAMALGFAAVGWLAAGVVEDRFQVGMAALAGFSAVGAMACLWAASRPVTVRLVGLVVFLAFAAYLVDALVSGPPEGRAEAAAGFVVLGVPAGFVAITGRYPRWGRHAAAFGEHDRPVEGP